jgi:hypothetical protein
VRDLGLDGATPEKTRVRVAGRALVRLDVGGEARTCGPLTEAAEAALAGGGDLPVRAPHLALTGHAFEKTPAARLGNRPLTDAELAAYRRWRESGGEVSDRSVLLMLGMR